MKFKDVKDLKGLDMERMTNYEFVCLFVFLSGHGFVFYEVFVRLVFVCLFHAYCLFECHCLVFRSIFIFGVCKCVFALGGWCLYWCLMLV